MARDYAKISPRFWTGDTGRKIRGNRNAQVLAAYLISAPGSSMTGIYYLPMPVVAHETGMTAGEVAKAMRALMALDFVQHDEEAEIVWVVGMAAWQIDDELKPNDKRVFGVRKELAALGAHQFVSGFWERYGRAFSLGECPLPSPSEGPSKPLRSQDQDQEQDQEQEVCSEPPAVTEPPLMVFPCKGTPVTWGLVKAFVDGLTDTWPGIDVMAECREARAWATANPLKRKTARGMPAFITRWMGNANDKPRRNGHGQRQLSTGPEYPLLDDGTGK